jgi:hypothetical protein
MDDDWKIIGPFKLPPHEAAVDLPNLTRKYPPTKSKVTFSEVAEMLRKVGAPIDKAIQTLSKRAEINPVLMICVQDPEIQSLSSFEARMEALCCYDLARCINHPLAYRPSIDGKLQFREKGKSGRTPLDRAWYAIEELRRVLPTIIEPFEDAMRRAERHYISPPSRAREMREHRDSAINRLDVYKQILSLARSLPNRTRISTPWHLDGARLLEVYRYNIHPSAGISPSGPALRFIRAALRRIGYGNLPSNLRSGLYHATNWREKFLLSMFEDHI